MNAMTTRSPSAHHCDVDISLYHEYAQTRVRCLIKQTFLRSGKGWQKAQPWPLFNDFRYAGGQVPMLAESDFFPRQTCAEVQVSAIAHAAHGQKVAKMHAGIRVGPREHQIAVIGDRRAKMVGGHLQISEIEPFSTCPISWKYAYGGAPVANCETTNELPIEVAWERGGPVAYPRNPLGKGYARDPENGVEFLLPNLEDPLDPLTRERLVCAWRQPWWHHPLPVGFEPMSLDAFPRSAYAGLIPQELPANLYEIPEVASGQLDAARFHPNPGTFPTIEPTYFLGMGPSFWVDRNPLHVHGLNVAFTGLHPEQEVQNWYLNQQVPAVNVRFDAQELFVKLALHKITLFPHFDAMTVVWDADCVLAENVVPGESYGHSLAVSVDGSTAGSYYMQDSRWVSGSL